MYRGSIFQTRFFLLLAALSSFNVIIATTFLILKALFLNFTNKLFVIGKKSCLRHLTARPRYCLRQSGTTNSLRLTKKWYQSTSLATSRYKSNFRPQGLISAIPQSWKKLLHINSHDSIATTSPPPIGTITCKMSYNRLLTLENLAPPTSKKNSYLLNKSYALTFTATKEVKLAMFQYKIIHNILSTNSILYKMKKVAFPSCPFCPSDCQNMHHLFISCPQASSFWYKFQRWYSTVCNASLLLSEQEVLFGITRPCTHRLTFPQPPHNAR